jgi:hypothetical protein
MAAKLTRLIHEITIQLHLMAESYTFCSSRSMRPIRKLLDTPSGVCWTPIFRLLVVITKTVCKVRGLSLLLRVGTLWRCDDGLFSKYLPWQAMHFLQRSTHFSKMCCRPFDASLRRIVELAFLTSKLPFHGWKSLEIAWGEIWTVWQMF